MFCERCGTRIPDGQTQCPNCKATPKAVQQNVNYAQQVNPSGGFQLNTPAGMPGRPPKKKSGAVTALLVGGVVLALLAVILAAVFSGVFASPAGRLEKLEKTNAKLIAEAAAQTYGSYLDSLEESMEKLEKGTSSQVDVTLSVDQNFLTALIAPMVGTDMTSLDLSWFDSVLIRMDADIKGTQTSLACGIGINDTVLATVDMLADLSGKDLYLGVPELNEQYLYMDLEQMGVSVEQALAAMEPMEQLIKELPSEKEMRKMIGTYLDIVFSYVEEVEKTKETVTIGEQSKEVTVLQAKITERKLLELVIELAKTAQNDEILKDLVQAVDNYISAATDVSSMEDAYAQLQAELANTVENLEAEIENADPENYILLSNYISGGMIVGRRVEVFSRGEFDEEVIRYLFLSDKDGGTFEAVVPDLTIKGELVGKNVELTLNVEGEDVLTLAAEKLEVKNGALNGILRLIPGQALLCELTYSGVPASMLSDTYLQLSFEGSRTAGTTQLQLAVGGNVLAQIGVQAKEEKYKSISAPSNVIPADSEDDLMTWVTGIRFDTLVKNMQTAGVPNEYVQVVQQLEMMLQIQGMLS